MTHLLDYIQNRLNFAPTECIGPQLISSAQWRLLLCITVWHTILSFPAAEVQLCNVMRQNNTKTKPCDRLSQHHIQGSLYLNCELASWEMWWTGHEHLYVDQLSNPKALSRKTRDITNPSLVKLHDEDCGWNSIKNGTFCSWRLIGQMGLPPFFITTQISISVRLCPIIRKHRMPSKADAVCKRRPVSAHNEQDLTAVSMFSKDLTLYPGKQGSITAGWLPSLKSLAPLWSDPEAK